MPNQDPADLGGANAFGRWDCGAWFFPAQTSLSAAGPGPLGPNTAVGPVLALAPTALTFSSTLNVTTPGQTVTVSNIGSAALRITSITLGGANPGRFGLTQNCRIGGTGLAAGGSCTITVTFTPNRNQARSALVRVNVAAPAVSGTVTLAGTTIRSTIVLSPTTIAFGNSAD